ncbi:MAG: phosphoribosylglycinamide formyltransferase [Planctomycetota bacterium]|nr:phosphoribosylglycinamide formyltransferase [Planctomycetota bacterium]
MKSCARLVVLASGGGRTLENLHQRILGGHLDAEISLVIVSRGDLGAAERARRLQLPMLVIGPKNYPNTERRNDLLIGAILEARPDWVILAGWLQLLPIPPQLEGRVLNIHPALLPAYGGKGFWGHHVHEAVVKDGALLSGCTVHFATSEYDQGPAVLQTAVALEGKESADEVAAKVFAAETEAFPEALELLIDGRLTWHKNQVYWGNSAPVIED